MAINESGQYKYRIKSDYSTYREKEKKIADYILEHPEEIIHATISQVAEHLDVAEATVFRFCKKIGFKGYQAMKIALASEVVTDMADIHEKILPDDTESQIAEKVFKSNIRTLEETLSIIDGEQFHRAVKMILHSNKLDFFGNGGSGVVAMDAHHKFMRTGIPTTYNSDSHLQIMAASQLTEKDTAILISHSGSNRDILQILEILKENKVQTIGITTLAKSPLSRGVDVALYTISEETDYRSEALASRLAQLSLIDALYVNISIQRKELMKQSLSKIRHAIAVKRI